MPDPLGPIRTTRDSFGIESFMTGAVRIQDNKFWRNAE